VDCGFGLIAVQVVLVEDTEDLLDEPVQVAFVIERRAFDQLTDTLTHHRDRLIIEHTHRQLLSDQAEHHLQHLL
jgi:hypothetical protein